MRRLLLSVLLGLFLSLQAQAQSISSPAAPSAPATRVVLGQSVIALNGPWKFRVGDDPHWADPNYEDATWELVDLTPRVGSFDPTTGWSGYVPGWTVQGHPDYWGYAWYRMHVRLNAGSGQSFAVIGPSNVDGAYQVFANGVLLGSFGKFPENGQPPVEYTTQPVMFQLPPVLAGNTDLVVAFRVWTGPHILAVAPDAGGFHSAPLLGDSGAIAAYYQLTRLALDRTYTFGAVTAVLFFLLAIMACTLVLFDRADPVYWWLGAVFLLTAIQQANSCLASWTQFESVGTSTMLTDAFLGPLILGGWVMVWCFWFRLRDVAWMPKVVAALTLSYMLSAALGEDIFFNAIPHPVSGFFHVASMGIRVLFLLPLLFIVIEGVTEQGWEGLLALPAILLVGLAQFQTELTVLHYRTEWFPFGVQVTISEIANLTLAAVIFALLLRRLLLSIRQQQELVTEVKHAQEVQQILIPEELPRLPGLAFESEYRPARDVGGDFFQITPHATDGSTLIVAGDVTGKGLKAGMLGALIVGAIGTEAAHFNDPLAILASLNARLYKKGHATCLALRVARDGGAILANAGHLPPYLNGKELPMEGALPLGIIANPEFSEMRFQLEPSDVLMLLSDGIAEAQNEHGKLFGFGRIRDLLQKPVTAAEIADAAQAFGQQDDISVLSITRMTIPGEPVVWRTRPEVQTAPNMRRTVA